MGGLPYTVVVTGGESGNPVVLTIDASAATVCSISGSVVSFIGFGNCVIDANQAGGGGWAPADQVQQTFPVVRGDQIITFGNPPVKPSVGGSYTPSASATSTLTVDHHDRQLGLRRFARSAAGWFPSMQPASAWWMRTSRGTVPTGTRLPRCSKSSRSQTTRPSR